MDESAHLSRGKLILYIQASSAVTKAATSTPSATTASATPKVMFDTFIIFFLAHQLVNSQRRMQHPKYREFVHCTISNLPNKANWVSKRVILSGLLKVSIVIGGRANFEDKWAFSL